MATLPCPACAKVLRFQDKDLGRKVHCPQCGQRLVLQNPDAIADDATVARRRAKSDPAATTPPLTRENRPIHPREGRKQIDLPNTNAEAFLAPAENENEIGRLGGYHILKKLGSGGMGIVYLAEDAALNRKIALKILPHSVINDPKARDRFFREARAAAALEHENIVTIYQVSEDRGIPFLAMPVLRGRSLDEEMRERGPGRISEAEILQIGREIAAGLAAAHELDIVHRDIKPANIWLEDLSGRSSSEKTFRVKVLDFGLARSIRRSAGLTETGFIVGTPSYMSPEQARGPNVDARSDLFSLGAVLYELVTGQRPFPGSDAIAVLSSLAVDIPLPPNEVRDDVSDDLSDLIMELLEKNPALRPSDAGEVMDRLSQMESGDDRASLKTRRLSNRSIQRPRPRSFSPTMPVWVWILSGGFGAFSALAFVGWLLLDSSPVAKKPLDGKQDLFPEAKAPPIEKLDPWDAEFDHKKKLQPPLMEGKKKKEMIDGEFGPKKGPPPEEIDVPPEFRFPPPKKKKDDGKLFGPKKGPEGL